MPGAGAFEAVLVDPTRELVAVHYQLAYDVQAASVRELRAMVRLVAELADALHTTSRTVRVEALRDCPEYKYRNFPGDIVPDASLWCVSGLDRAGPGGVLEWCVDEADALHVLEQMKRFPERFKNLAAQKWSEGVFHWSARAA
jgi:hypothetical protein